IAACRENPRHHYSGQCAGHRDAKRILVGLRCSEKRALHSACGDPRAAACAEKHRQTLHKESTKHKFLVKACADQRIENAKCCEFQISSYILELAEVTTKSRLFRKIHDNENT